MQPPKCPHCSERHWQIEGCGLLSAGESAKVNLAAEQRPAVVASELRGIAGRDWVREEVNQRDMPPLRADFVEQPEIVARNMLPTDLAAVIADSEAIVDAMPQGPNRALAESLLQTAPVAAFKAIRDNPGHSVANPPAEMLQSDGVALTSTAHPVGATYQMDMPAGFAAQKRPRLHAAALETVEISDDGWTDEQRARAIIVAEGRRLLALRKALKMSQPKFSAAFHVPVGTLRGWESGRHKMPPYFLALLRVIEREPKAVFRALGIKA